MIFEIFYDLLQKYHTKEFINLFLENSFQIFETKITKTEY